MSDHLSLTPEQREQVKELLEEILPLPPQKRLDLLRKEADDNSVRQEVLSLLEHWGNTADLLTADILALRSTSEAEFTPGEKIGPYRLIRPLGTGGMGTVVLATRIDDFNKEVALKLVRPGPRSEELLRRFHKERQILAHLEHPFIARILDGGSAEDGRPYFVMEYVEGLPINTFCTNQKLGLQRRIELVLRICEALRTAHQSLVVHRDLKPSNILVTTDGTPKLLDFGIAKRLNQKTNISRLGQGPMTLHYASPEQVEARPITTASDIYSVGVMLYELLTERSPYTDGIHSDLALAQAIVNQEVPPPSTKATSRQQRRHLEGDLDAITAKALRKESQHRYGSAEELAEDLRRYLDGRPVRARRGTWSYRMGKLLRRHWLILSATVLLFSVILVSAATTTTLWRKADHERKRSERTVEFLRELFLSADPDYSKDAELTAREFLSRGLGRIEDLADDPILQADLLRILGQVNVELGHYEIAQEARQRELEILRHEFGTPHADVALALNNLAAVHFRLGHLDRAENLHRQAIQMERDLGGVPDTKLINLAAVLMSRGAYDEAEATYREVLQSRTALHGPSHRLVAKSLRDLGNLLYSRGEAEQAEPLLLRAWELRRTIFGPEHTQTAKARASLARVLHALQRWQEAEDAYLNVLETRRKRLGEGHPHVAVTRRDLAALYLDLDDAATATVLLNQAQAVLRRVYGEDSWQVADIESLIGTVLSRRGDHEAAVACLEQSIATLKRTRGEKAVYTRNARSRLYAAQELAAPELTTALSSPHM